MASFSSDENNSSDSDLSDSDYIPKKKLKLDVQSKTILHNIQAQIKSNEPDLMQILNSNLLLDDQCKLLQLFEMYKLSEANTEGWLELRDKFIVYLKESTARYTEFSKYTPEDHVLEQEIKTETTIDLKYKIISSKTSLANKKIMYEKYIEYTGLNSIGSNTEEKCKLRNWLNWVVNIPFEPELICNLAEKEELNILNVSKLLDGELFGMKKIKDQILVYISKKIKNPDFKCSLALIGSPGSGKTHISRLIGKVLGLPFEQISLGGISHAEFFKGHDYTYIGSQPGEIVKCLKRMKCNNGIIFLDEFDKISSNKEVSSVLLHVTDPIQNFEFKDNFTGEIVIDLSKIWFIYSMNSLPEDTALKDRIYPIEIPEYTFEDKQHIIVDFLFPRYIDKKKVVVSLDVAKHIINKIPTESIRRLEFLVKSICDKLDFLATHTKKELQILDVGFDIETNSTFSTKSTKKQAKSFFPCILTPQMIDALI
jgi:ATP-dependent Lon protease